MTVREANLDRTRTLRVPLTRGAISGLLLVVLGAWGALVPFIGPYFDYSYQSNATWMWSVPRFWLEVLPGGAAALGGLLVLASRNRVTGSLGGWLAAAAGAWFVVGRTLAAPWRIGSVGEPLATHDRGRAIADLGYFYGLGAVILFLAAFALGRLAVVGVRDVLAAQRDEERVAEAARVAERERQAELDRQVVVDRQAAAERQAAITAEADRRAAINQQVAAEPARPVAEPVAPTYDPADGRPAEFTRAPAHSADPAVAEPSPYDPRV